jgi:hypothetical protein
MELHFTPEQEAQLAQIATTEGTDAERLVKDAALRLLEEDARFRTAVREGIAQADRGVPHRVAHVRTSNPDAYLVDVCASAREQAQFACYSWTR